jgi:hypothetical protein
MYLNFYPKEAVHSVKCLVLVFVRYSSASDSDAGTFTAVGLSNLGCGMAQKGAAWPG